MKHLLTILLLGITLSGCKCTPREQAYQKLVSGDYNCIPVEINYFSIGLPHAGVADWDVVKNTMTMCVVSIDTLSVTDIEFLTRE
jgi:hypothetical protein